MIFFFEYLDNFVDIFLIKSSIPLSSDNSFVKPRSADFSNIKLRA